MERPHIGMDNWFLVIPAALLGLVALFTVNRMYRAGDLRRAVEVVTTYEADERIPFADWLQSREGVMDCRADMVSRFYGTLDVTCSTADGHNEYRWRVHVGQLAFAPADDSTLQLMRSYAPEVFDTTQKESS